jgi:hypothetical protein
MKKIILLSFVIVTAFFTSCKEEDEGKLPNISFKSGANYTSADATVGMGDTITIGIQASKAEDKDVLKTFDATLKYDNGSDSSFYNESLSGSKGDNYSNDIQIIARNVAGKESYTFTVINRDGLRNSVGLTLTVQ